MRRACTLCNVILPSPKAVTRHCSRVKALIDIGSQLALHPSQQPAIDARAYRLVCGRRIVLVPRNHYVSRPGQVEPTRTTDVRDEIFAVA